MSADRLPPLATDNLAANGGVAVQRIRDPIDQAGLYIFASPAQVRSPAKCHSSDDSGIERFCGLIPFQPHSSAFPRHLPGCFSTRRLHSFTPRDDISSIRSISSRTYSSPASNRSSYSGPFRRSTQPPVRTDNWERSPRHRPEAATRDPRRRLATVQYHRHYTSPLFLGPPIRSSLKFTC